LRMPSAKISAQGTVLPLVPSVLQSVPLLASGSVQPVIDSVFPLEQIQDAHRRLESNETFGKVVLTMP